MVQAGTKRPPFDLGGFAAAAMLAPGLALAIFYVVVGVTRLAGGPDVMGPLIGNFLGTLAVVSIWGCLPSLVFGGLVLAMIRQMPWRRRPTTVVFVCGGAVAAGLYVLTGLGTADLSPHVAMLFAPWATPEVREGTAGLDLWLVTSLVLAGAGAGLIYAAIAKRG